MAVETYFCYCIDVSILADPSPLRGVLRAHLSIIHHHRCSNLRNDQIALDLATTAMKESLQ